MTKRSVSSTTLLYHHYCALLSPHFILRYIVLWSPPAGPCSQGLYKRIVYKFIDDIYTMGADKKHQCFSLLIQSAWRSSSIFMITVQCICMSARYIYRTTKIIVNSNQSVVIYLRFIFLYSFRIRMRIRQSVTHLVWWFIIIIIVYFININNCQTMCICLTLFGEWWILYLDMLLAKLFTTSYRSYYLWPSYYLIINYRILLDECSFNIWLARIKQCSKHFIIWYLHRIMKSLLKSMRLYDCYCPPNDFYTKFCPPNCHCWLVNVPFIIMIHVVKTTW